MHFLSQAFWQILGAVRRGEGKVPVFDWKGTADSHGHTHQPNGGLG